MYTPPSFREVREEVLHQLLREYPLATLVIHGPNGLEATHVPLLLQDGVLRGHVARANPISDAGGVAAVAIFQGPEHYISPGWYATKQTDPRVVPTWNYIAVHVHGTLRTFREPERLRRIVAELTESMEQRREEPWSIADAPSDYIDKLLQAITGIEIPAERIEGKWKVSQNRSAADRQSVAAALDGDPMGDAVREAL
ncbi:MAG TPA: FMN-binding negative transcriptional regulator [Bryobacteraceae bacterium]|nr:FMN-binding negative transcriptional regulator [Bryobacteraceae bacterium]